MNEQSKNSQPLCWRRWLLIVGLSALAGGVTLGFPSLAKPHQQGGPSWETVLAEDFDDPLSDAWTVTDTSSADGGEYLWSVRSFTRTGELTYAQPLSAVWSVGGGADGISLTAGVSTYVDNVDSWLIYGPLNVATVLDGELTFDWWLDTPTGTAGGAGFFRTLNASASPTGGDWLSWCVLMDVNNLQECQGTYVSGSTGDWLSATLSLKPYIQLSRAPGGTPYLWLAFHFISDGDGRVGQGAFVDNVTLRLQSGYKVFLPLAVRNYPPVPVLNPIPAPDNRAYTVSWQAVEADLDHYVLQQARSSDFISADQVWTTTLTSQAISDAYCAYYYRVRVDKTDAWGVGPWSNVEQGVASPPDPPVLNDIPQPDASSSYTVSWSAVSAPAAGVAVDHYVLQEAGDANFTLLTREWTVTGTSQLISGGAAYGTLYYRVRADDDDCWGAGPWSAVKSVEVIFLDNFTSATTGWPDDKGLIYYEKNKWDSYWYRGYLTSSGEYRLKVDPLPAPLWFYQPDALASYRPPSNTYCVETKVRFETTGWWANAGLIFGANEANTDLYILCLGSGFNQLGWHITRNHEYTFPKQGCAYQAGVIAQGNEGTTWGGWNLLQVSVNGDWIHAYVGGVDIGSYQMPGLGNTTRVGVVGGEYEVSPIDIRYDYFKVTPNAACQP
jgi:hypothetical protein